MAELRLGPDELDRLEDALEGLEFVDDLGALDEPSEAVTRRLADFRSILQASREAMPLEDVPLGLLDGVFAEARMSVKDIQPPKDIPAQPGLWSRLRSAWLIPGLAVAGSAALVLLLLQPTLSGDEPAADAGSIAVNDAPSPAEAEAPAAGAPEGEATEEISQAAAEQAPAPPPPAAAERAAIAKAEDAPTPSAAPMPDPEAAAQGADTKDVSAAGWNAIEEGDKSRKGGDCFSARNHYAKALDDGNDSVRARAYVGLGLCKREEGNEAAANEYFDKARELDQDALDFAGTQSKPQVRPAPKRARKKASGSKQKSAIDFDEAPDPLQ